MTQQQLQHFVLRGNVDTQQLPWGICDWLSRPGLTDAQGIMLVQIHIPPHTSQQFHRHPHLEELIYIQEGTAEQWVDREQRILRPGEVAYIPRDVVHGTYNPFATTLRFLTIYSPARTGDSETIEVYEEEPWRTLKVPADYYAQ